MIVLVPSAIALLPAYAGIEDPLPRLRAACRSAVAELVATAPARVAVVAAPVGDRERARGMTASAGARIAGHLLEAAGFGGTVVEGAGVEGGGVEGAGPADAALVVANGTACRGEKAPGHLDERSFGFDESVRRALVAGEGHVLRDLDAALAEELWCFDVPALGALGGLVDGRPGLLRYDADPFGVQYWVASWR